MVALPNARQTLKIRLTGRIQTQNWASIQYAQYQGAAPSAAQLITAAESISTGWANSIGVQCVSTVSLRQVDLIDLTDPTSAQGSSTTVHAGTKAGTGPSNQVACVASYRVNFRYRGGHPRTYWPMGTTTSYQNGNLWTSAELALFQNAASSWVGNVNAVQLNGLNLMHGLLSYYTSDGGNPPHTVLRETPLFYPTQSVQVHTRVDTQRRRLGREVA